VARTLYLTAAGPESGKSAIALGLFEAMSHRVSRVAVFRPVIRADRPDPLLRLLSDRYDVDFSDAWGTDYDSVHADPDAAVATVVDRFGAIERQHDAVLVVGTDYTDVAAPTELAFNARLALNLRAPVVLVLDARTRETPADIATAADVARAALEAPGCSVLGVIANRVPPGLTDTVRAALTAAKDRAVQTAAKDRAVQQELDISVVPEEPLLSAPSLQQVFDICGAQLVAGAAERLDQEVLGFVVAAMTLPRVLQYLTRDGLVIVPCDRADMLIGVLMAHRSHTYPRLSGILLTGGMAPVPGIMRLVEGLGNRLPIALTAHNTFESATLASGARGDLTDGSRRKAEAALGLVSGHVDCTHLLDRLDLARSEAITPLMFGHDLAERARADRRTIVLPEGTEPRVLRAAAAVLRRRLADLVLLGDPAQVRAAADRCGADIGAAQILDPADEGLRHRLATEYAQLRAHKGITYETALDVVTDVSYAGALLVGLGLADGMVSGAVHTTAHTIRPAFEIIKTTPGAGLVSSVFFMCLADRVLVYGDCAVNPDPTAEQLADIAISSATTAAAFGVEPRVAMLSYSTGESGQGADVDKVRTATALVRQRRPDLEIDGPIQYDAATDAGVAATKLPDSTVAGRATVLVFPDLNTGNNTYKAVQRSAGALAVGPVLQGLRRPVNDLSRGATVDDIVTTIAITAVQAQQLAAADLAGVQEFTAKPAEPVEPVEQPVHGGDVAQGRVLG
jgi:phosphate acetyltransferase